MAAANDAAKTASGYHKTSKGLWVKTPTPPTPVIKKIVRKTPTPSAVAVLKQRVAEQQQRKKKA